MARRLLLLAAGKANNLAQRQVHIDIGETACSGTAHAEGSFQGWACVIESIFACKRTSSGFACAKNAQWLLLRWDTPKRTSTSPRR